MIHTYYIIIGIVFLAFGWIWKSSDLFNCLVKIIVLACGVLALTSKTVDHIAPLALFLLFGGITWNRKDYPNTVAAFVLFGLGVWGFTLLF